MPVGKMNSMPGIQRFLRAKTSGVRGHDCPTSPNRLAGASREYMKAKIIITPKKAVVDPQGKTVQGARDHMGYTGVGAVHVGKYLEIELTGTDAEAARRQLDDACRKFLSNPVIEDFKLEIEP